MPAFFGLVAKPGKGYQIVVEEPIRITMASVSSTPGSKQASLYVKVDEEEPVLLCTLSPGRIDQQVLDIMFVEGEEVELSCKGDCEIHLSGNYMPSMDDMMPGYEGGSGDEEITSEEDVTDGEDVSDDEEDDEEMDEDEIEELIMAGKRAAEEAEVKPAKKARASVEPKIQEIKEEEEPVKMEAKKDVKPVKETKPAKETKETKPVKETKETKPVKETKEVAKKEQPKEESNTKKTLPSGLIIEDIQKGDGARTKNGKRVQVRYIGKLMNGKVFDSNTSGKPFSFVLGKGEVIKGWDLGLQNMQIGGRRKLTIPPQLAYGASGAPPDIGKNATLQFEIKLLAIK